MSVLLLLLSGCGAKEETSFSVDGGRILIDPGKSDLKPGVMIDLYKEILRYYLSLGSVAYLDGPSLSFGEAGN